MLEEYNLKSDQPFLDMTANIIPMLIWVTLLVLYIIVNVVFFGMGLDIATLIQYGLIIVPLILMTHLTLEIGKRI
ncbi:MAG: DUF6684 family protein [Halobacteria archaeon]